MFKKIQLNMHVLNIIQHLSNINCLLFKYTRTNLKHKRYYKLIEVFMDLEIHKFLLID